MKNILIIVLLGILVILGYSYVTPEKSAVLEVRAMNVTNSKNWHSCGLGMEEEDHAYSLRIASVERYRDDKSVKDINTTEQVSELYVK